MSKNPEEKSYAETPLMKQYNQIKGRHPEALLLFRVGDFYETFGEDAIKTSKILGIVLTKRKNGAAATIELAGFPHHSLEVYLPKLVRAGQRVAVCDQLEDPKMTKTIVKRGVTELVTPGVSFNDQVLEKGKNNFLCAIHIGKSEHGISFLDVSTGEFLVAQGNQEYIDKLVSSFEPSEIVYQRNKSKEFSENFTGNYYTFRFDDWAFTTDFALESLTKHFGTKSLKGFGIENLELGIIAAGAVLHYLTENQHANLGHITALNRIEEDKYVWLDRFTIRNLELLHSPHENATTLADVIDNTLTPMGGRMMRRWIVLPLKHKKPIQERLDTVAYLKTTHHINDSVRDILADIGDLERLISKVAVGKINPKELVYLKRTLEQIDPLKNLLHGAKTNAIIDLVKRLNPCSELISLIETRLAEDPAVLVGKGPVIRAGFHAELDEIRNIRENGRDYLEDLQKREAERTGITSLRIAFNGVFGYYIEVRNTHKDKVPPEWIRKQTLVNAERYITEELKEYETKIFGAEDRIHQIETALFQEIVEQASKYTLQVQENALLIARLDCLSSFAFLALERNYNQPEITEGFDLEYKNGRHPVIEKQLKTGEEYIPNDLRMSNDDLQIMMITGPNMSGKSAILRQTALIVLLAQMGCFVPADSATIGLVDKVFTRVGASDNISSGESTFMVEMNETASILNNISPRSLILLDEIGRGTSTYDGISIAWAIAEFLHENPKAKCKTLFATHYHELNEMTKQYARIKNYTVAVKEVGKRILFLRKLIEGGSEHSFGIHVARIAGMPPVVVQRAEEVLRELEATHQQVGNQNDAVKSAKPDTANMQLSFFQLNDPVLEQIHEELIMIDINTLTPVEALMKLHEIKKLTGG